jgi:hypothetical protein
MTTPPQTPNTQPGGYTAGQLGGGFEMPAPLPNVTPYLLRQEDFLTLRDGEMSEYRALRDACFGAFLVGAAEIASHLSDPEWVSAFKQGRATWSIVIFIITATTLILTVTMHTMCRRMSNQSAYARQIHTISAYFGIKDSERGIFSWLRGFFGRPRS